MVAADVSRFVEPQQRDFATALAEIEGGRKRSHWIWYVFPQIAGLGHSSTAQFYGIASLDEARSFLAHPLLGVNYGRIAAAVLEQVRAGIGLHRLLGAPDDAKVVSSLTLFAGVVADDDPLRSLADEVLRRDGRAPCATTLAFLAAG